MRKTLLHSLLLALLGSPVFATELLQNPGFETGQLPPWFQARDNCSMYCVDWVVVPFGHSGQYSASVVGDIELRQNFTPTPASQITSVSFWVEIGAPYGGSGAVDFFYTDSSDESFGYTVNSGNWAFVDVTNDVDKNKTLMGFSIWGGGQTEMRYFDDLSVQAVPEPGSLVLVGSGLLALGGLARRKFNL